MLSEHFTWENNKICKKKLSCFLPPLDISEDVAESQLAHPCLMYPATCRFSMNLLAMFSIHVGRGSNSLSSALSEPSLHRSVLLGVIKLQEVCAAGINDKKNSSDDSNFEKH